MSDTQYVENTSGMGERAVVPLTVMNKFNWGAFLCTWIWGIGNKTYITFLIFLGGFIPFLNIILTIWFGIKGNEWAWRNKRFESEIAFHEYQRFWAIIGIFLLVFTTIAILILTVAIVKGIMSIKI